MAFDPVQTSRFLSLVLRHKPGVVGLALDAQGWVGVDGLLAALARHGRPLSRAELEAVVAGNDKRRFTFDPAGERIRANQGHSVAVELDLAALPPPAVLFHGTVARSVGSIRRGGLVKGQRQHVHLSADAETAEKVGARRGRPVVLTVDAGGMHAAGFRFFRSANGVWLTDQVPPVYLDFPAAG